MNRCLAAAALWCCWALCSWRGCDAIVLDGKAEVPTSAASILVQRSSRSSLGPNIVENGNFTDSLTHWLEYNAVNRYEGPKVHNCSGHMLAHLHTLCRHSGGGLQQDLLTETGTTYVLYFEAYSGPWASQEAPDLLRVNAADLKQLIEIGSEHRLNQSDADGGLELNCSVTPYQGEFEFTATDAVTPLKFWAPQGGCVDIAAVTVRSKFGHTEEEHTEKTEAEEEADGEAAIKAAEEEDSTTTEASHE